MVAKSSQKRVIFSAVYDIMYKVKKVRIVRSKYE